MFGSSSRVPMGADPPAWVRRVGRSSWAFLGFAGAAAVVMYVMASLSDIVIPLLVAAFLAVVFAPVVDRLERHRIPRPVGALIVILLIGGVFAATVGIVVIGVVEQSDELAAAFDDARDRVSDLIERGNLEGVIDSLRDQATGSGSVLRDGLGERAGSAIGSAVGIATGLVIGVVLLYYLLKDGRALVASWIEKRSENGAAQADRILSQAAASVRGYVRGRTALAVVQGVAVSLALWVLGVPLAGSVGVVNFIGSYIPYLGAVVGGTFAVLMGLASGGPSMAGAALLIVLFVNLVLENLLEPKFVGSTLRLHPVVVLVSTIAGGLLIGMLGLILAAPSVAIGLNLLKELRESGFFDSGHDHRAANGSGDVTPAMHPAAELDDVEQTDTDPTAPRTGGPDSSV